MDLQAILKAKLKEAKAQLEDMEREVQIWRQRAGTCQSINHIGETVVIKKNSTHFPSQEAK